MERDVGAEVGFNIFFQFLELVWNMLHPPPPPNTSDGGFTPNVDDKIIDNIVKGR